MVENVKETIRFYQEVLEFDLVDQVTNNDGQIDWAFVKKDEVMIMLQERTNLIGEYTILDIDRVRPSLSLFIFVDNIYELFDLVKDKCQVLKEIKVTSYGINEFAIADNNGYVLTFAEFK